MIFATHHHQARLQSTVLFINGNPVGYNIYKEGGKYLLQPGDAPGNSNTPPTIVVRYRNEHWEIEQIKDQDLIDQVLEDMNLFFGTSY